MRSCASVSLKAGFHCRRSRSRNQRRRTIKWNQRSDSVYDSVAYDQVKTRSSESQAEEEDLSQSNKSGNVHCKWFILPFLLQTPTVWFLLDRKRRNHKRNRKKMETFWFFRLRFRRSCHSAYDSDSDSVANENQPLIGILLTLRDFPTFSQVVVIKKLVWLLPDRTTTSLQVVETSVTVTSSPIQDYNNSDDRKLWSYRGNVARPITCPTWK